MTFELHPAGGPFHDPALLVNFANSAESLLLDCGTLHALKTRDLLRVQWLILSHLHIDHLIGFDHLLRVRLFSELPLIIFGPAGTVKTIAHRLQGYAWNLTSGSPFRLEAFDLSDEGGVTAAASFRCQEQFQRRDLETCRWCTTSGKVQLLSDLTLQWHPVDHGVPCYCYRLTREFPPRFSLEMCRNLGLNPGPWVRNLMDPTLPLEAPLVDGQARDREWLSAKLLKQRPPQSLGFLTDTKLTPKLSQSLSQFFSRVDILISETAYLHEDLPMAQRNLHMTTKQVSQLALNCEAKELRIFHLSRRYQTKGTKAHLDEVRELFAPSDLLKCSPESGPAQDSATEEV